MAFCCVGKALLVCATAILAPLAWLVVGTGDFTNAGACGGKASGALGGNAAAPAIPGTTALVASFATGCFAIEREAAGPLASAAPGASGLAALVPYEL